jgi:protoporphyrinogen oxidase
MDRNHLVILGGGVTGLAASYVSDAPVYEQSFRPGGICGSYYMVPHGMQKFHRPTSDGECYRFEVGGGHWIFSQDAEVLRFIEQFTPIKTYKRKAAVFFAENQSRLVPYPLQYHLHHLDKTLVADIVQELSSTEDESVTASLTMKNWLLEQFGTTLCEQFFFPFHEHYTAGLYADLAPQDSYKTPPDRQRILRGLSQDEDLVGYNSSFRYPLEGLDAFVSKLGEQCKIQYNARSVRIDKEHKIVFFADGSEVPYELLLSTLPLRTTLEQCGIVLDTRPDPYTSVLVLNIGAERGLHCPDAHWIYVPHSRTGFHRVGFYSNVDSHFLPMSERSEKKKVALYVERSYREGNRPDGEETRVYTSAVINELQEWGIIGAIEIADVSWVEYAYTWSWPHSDWQTQAIHALETYDIYPVGRYARWMFQGIADSIRDGILAGNLMKG